MAVVRVRRSGITVGVGRPGVRQGGGARGEVVGWSPGSARRNAAWLQSIQPEHLDLENLVAVTLTLDRTPPDAEEWKRLRATWLERLRYSGVVGFHWVTEWTARGRPHLHAALILGPTLTGEAAVLAWLSVARGMGYAPTLAGQHVSVMYDVVGWLQYLAKHLARGINHYQRAGVPSGWTTSGRIWGHGGHWPVLEESAFDVQLADFWRLRRYIRAALIAEARAAGDWRRVARLRRLLRCSDPARSRVKGVGVWLDDSVSWLLVDRALRG